MTPSAEAIPGTGRNGRRAACRPAAPPVPCRRRRRAAGGSGAMGGQGPPAATHRSADAAAAARGGLGIPGQSRRRSQDGAVLIDDAGLRRRHRSGRRRRSADARRAVPPSISRTPRSCPVSSTPTPTSNSPGSARQLDEPDFPSWIRRLRALKAERTPEQFLEAAKQGIARVLGGGRHHRRRYRRHRSRGSRARRARRSRRRLPGSLRSATRRRSRRAWRASSVRWRCSLHSRPGRLRLASPPTRRTRSAGRCITK